MAEALIEGVEGRLPDHHPVEVAHRPPPERPGQRRAICIARRIGY